ncbi:MAG: alpha/beta fold hydrolase [archaeon]|nr:alpha/beta fold hydrolase [archaeon]
MIKMKHNGIYYEKISSQNPKGTLILLPGLTGNIEKYSNYVNNLKKDYNFVLFDLIGHGNSDFPNNLKSFSIENQAKIITQILKKERVPKSTIISHSYSLNIALEIINQNPNKFKSLIMISPFSLECNQKAKKKAKYVKLFLPFWKFFPHIRKSISKEEWKKIDEGSFLDNKLRIKEIGIKSYFAHINSCLKSNSLSKIKKITLPSLIICKEDDPLSTQEILKTLEQKIPKLKIQKIQGNGHRIFKHDQEEVLKKIKSFLRHCPVGHS